MKQKKVKVYKFLFVKYKTKNEKNIYSFFLNYISVLRLIIEYIIS